MKKPILVLIVGLWATSYAGVIGAQELLAPPHEEVIEGAVPDLALPPGVEAGEVISEQDAPYEGESWQYSEGAEHVYSPGEMDEYSMAPCDPLLLESTGTWLRRGFWYAEVDAVISNRMWNRDTYILMQQPVGVSIGPLQQQLRFNELTIGGTRPGSETVPRLTLGRFLFRDSRNRDHVGEFTIYGGGQWTQESMLQANPNNSQGSTTLSVPTELDLGNDSFDGATSSQFRYDSRFNSFELNYHVKERMGRDHMELEPSGHWVRRAGPTISRSLIAGLRFFDMNEDFNWTADGIGSDPNTGDQGELGVVQTTTDNDMLGTQLGFTWARESARWSLGMKAKGGMYVNIIDVRSSASIPIPTDDSFTEIDSVLDSEDIGFVGEAALLGKYHIQPNFSLRAGFEVLYITGTALAPHQISFVPGGPSRVVATGDPVYLGGIIGFEGYW